MKTPDGAVVTLLVEYGDECLRLPLLEANKVGQLLVACTAVLSREAYLYAAGQELELPRKAPKKPQVYMVPIPTTDKEEAPQG